MRRRFRLEFKTNWVRKLWKMITSTVDRRMINMSMDKDNSLEGFFLSEGIKFLKTVVR